jgi:hypothetical protein
MPIDLVAGLDDTATEKTVTSGWSFIILPKKEAAQFSAEARKLLPSGKAEFHAKKFRYRDSTAYSDFLSLLRRTAEGTPGSLLACSLNDQTWDTDFTSFVDRLLAGIFANLGITDRAVAEAAKNAAPSLFTLQRLLNSSSWTSAVVHLLEIDQNATTAVFASKTVNVARGSLSGTRLLELLAEAYRKQRFPGSPALAPSAIAIVESSTSLLVQAADVLGNFAMNYLIHNLGPTTPGRTAKARIFESAFQDVLPQTQFGQLASLNGLQLELGLKNAGALTFEVKHA